MNEKKKENSNKNKNIKKNISKLIYISGTAALIFMLAFSAVNFIRDARVLRLPVLSNAVSSDNDTKNSKDGDYKTLKYKKPVETDSPNSKKTPVPSKTAAPTPQPTPKAIPSGEP
ncbi:MAG: hypothetical protein FIA99_05300 [Ruminiclostridium sp.]|nr:hypothetical protein [Ruminiclostridium sp.]